MTFANKYIDKQKNLEVKVQEEPCSDLKFIVVIPCYNEPDLQETLLSLKNTQRPKSAVEVIIVVNSSEVTPIEILDQNRRTVIETESWIQENNDIRFRFFIIHETDLPKKFAGAGLARKIGMDQAVLRFNQLNNEDGIIISMDADSKVKENYFIELEEHFSKSSKTNAITCYFEHSIHGSEFDDDIKRAITRYELYLRYYKLALSFTGFPYSFYTIGSCFAVSAKAYVKQGGMNRKQAGEDFYFLHKIFPLGNCYEINSTCVYPSSRISDRVPFGTGPMVKAIIESGNSGFLTYNFEAFVQLKIFFEGVEPLFNIKQDALKELLNSLPEGIREFLIKNDIDDALKEIISNSSNINTFTKRFYNWFDAFKVLKYLNFVHENYFEKQELLSEVEKLCFRINLNIPENKDYGSFLEVFRKYERGF